MMIGSLDKKCSPDTHIKSNVSWIYCISTFEKIVGLKFWKNLITWREHYVIAVGMWTLCGSLFACTPSYAIIRQLLTHQPHSWQEWQTTRIPHRAQALRLHPHLAPIIIQIWLSYKCTPNAWYWHSSAVMTRVTLQACLIHPDSWYPLLLEALALGSDSFCCALYHMNTLKIYTSLQWTLL